MAASKEAIAIVLDVGPGMNQAPDGEHTNLETSIAAIEMVLQRKLFAESKDEVALILFGTPDTANDLANEEAYANITVARPLGLADWKLIQYLKDDVQPSTVYGDFVDAIVVAMDHLVKGIDGKRGFGSKRLILFSNLAGAFGDDQLDDIIGGLKEANIELNVIGPDLDEDDDEEEDDDDEDGGGDAGVAVSRHVKEKTAQQRAGEKLLKHVLANIEGESYCFSEALNALSFFQSRQVRSVAWKCLMEISSNLKIPICLYNRVKETKAKTFKNVYAKDPDAGIERLRTYHLNDEEETEIEKSDVVDGHRYGSTLVPFSEDDKEAMKHRAEKCFQVLGFTKSEHVHVHHKLGDATWVCIAEKGDEAASIALSAICNALYETNSVAIVRRVYSNNASVKLGVLVPNIKTQYECLIYNELPFAEDVRTYSFGSLPVKDENNAANKKLAPSEDQIQLMDDLITNMDLTQAERDDDDKPIESFKPKLIFNPHLQKMYQCLQHRALHPDDSLPQLSSVVANSIQPPQCIATQCRDTVEAMKSKFKLEKVKAKVKETAETIFKDDTNDQPAKKKAKVEDSELNGGIHDIIKPKVTEVGTVTPREDFEALIQPESEVKFDEACEMMKKRIVQLVNDSFGTQLYTKAMDCLRCLRKESIKRPAPTVFNKFLDQFKNNLKEIKRENFWEDIVKEGVSLISEAECSGSGVSQTEADTFLHEATQPEVPPPAEVDEDEEDLLAEMA